MELGETLSKLSNTKLWMLHTLVLGEITDRGYTGVLLQDDVDAAETAMGVTATASSAVREATAAAIGIPANVVLDRSDDDDSDESVQGRLDQKPKPKVILKPRAEAGPAVRARPSVKAEPPPELPSSTSSKRSRAGPSVSAAVKVKAEAESPSSNTRGKRSRAETSVKAKAESPLSRSDKRSKRKWEMDSDSMDSSS